MILAESNAHRIDCPSYPGRGVAQPGSALRSLGRFPYFKSSTDTPYVACLLYVGDSGTYERGIAMFRVLLHSTRRHGGQHDCR